jgi:hypothetical protein
MATGTAGGLGFGAGGLGEVKGGGGGAGERVAARTGRARPLSCARCEKACDAGTTTKNTWGQHLCAACHALAAAEDLGRR